MLKASPSVCRLNSTTAGVQIALRSPTMKAARSGSVRTASVDR